jgi:hypothetical protein
VHEEGRLSSLYIMQIHPGLCRVVDVLVQSLPEFSGVARKCRRCDAPSSGTVVGGSHMGGGGVGVEADFGGPARSLGPLLWAYGTKNYSFKAPPKTGPLGRGLWGPYAHSRGLRHRTGPPEPASTPMLPPPMWLPPRF